MTQRPDLQIKEDSVKPVFEWQLTERKSASVRRQAVDLTDADTVTFLMPVTEEGMVQETATIDDAENGDVVVELPSGIEDGDYDAEFRVEWSNGDISFYPQNRNLLVAVRAGTDRELSEEDLTAPDATVTTLFATNVGTLANPVESLVIGDSVLLPQHTSFGDAEDAGRSVFYAPGEAGDAIGPL